MHRRELSVVAVAAAFVSLAAIAGPASAMIRVVGGEVAEPRVEVSRVDNRGLAVSVELDVLAAREEMTEAGAFTRITFPAAAPWGEAGAPELPVVRRLVATPPGARVRFDVRIASPIVIDLDEAGWSDPLMPRQVSVPMTPDDLEPPAFELDPGAYAVDAFTPESRVIITRLGIMRGVALHLLEIRPVAYDAARHQLQLWPRVDVDLRFRGRLTYDASASLPARFEGLLLNPPPRNDRDRDGSKFLILAGEDFVGGLAPFIDAKIAQGFDVITETIAPGMTGQQIKAIVEGYWQTPDRPEYLLLVGRPEWIPVWTGGGDGDAPTDLPYACMDGPDDWIPDMAIGRFSVADAEQLATVIEKTLYVEHGVYSDPEYVKRVMLLAGTDQQCGDHATHNWVIENHLDPNEYTTIKVWERLGGTTQDVLETVDNGIVLGIYYGHSNWQHLYNGPSITKDNVRSLANEDAYPLFLAFSCNNTRFTYDDQCIGETWFVEPRKGASVVIGTTDYIYWSANPGWPETSNTEKFFFETLFTDEITQVSPVWQATMARLLAFYGPDNPASRDYAEMFNLLGDPSLEIPMEVLPGFRFEADPESIEVCAPESAVYSIDVIDIAGFSEPVMLSVDDVPDGGLAEFTMNPVTPPATTVLTISGTDLIEPGMHTMQISGVWGELTATMPLELGVSHQMPEQTTLLAPADAAVRTTLAPTFEWQAVPGALEYELQIAGDPDFDPPLYAFTDLAEPTCPLETRLEPDAQYWWRARATNGCGEADWSSVFSFTTVASLAPIAYDMRNGETGTYTYFDDLYDGDGDNTVPLAWLTNGLGELTDDVIATENWNETPGPYVGWHTIDPVITFHFNQSVEVDLVLLHVDDSNGSGSVYPPQDVTLVMGGETRTFAIEDPSSDGAPFAILLDDLGLEGETLEVTLADYSGVRYMMLSEVDIFGEAPNPCPADLNGDAFVNVMDLLVLLDAWGDAGGEADLNDDGIVNVLDLLTLLDAWGACE